MKTGLIVAGVLVAAYVLLYKPTTTGAAGSAKDRARAFYFARFPNAWEFQFQAWYAAGAQPLSGATAGAPALVFPG